MVLPSTDTLIISLECDNDMPISRPSEKQNGVYHSMHILRKIVKQVQYSRTCLERPSNWQQKCSLSWQVVSGDRLGYIEM